LVNKTNLSFVGFSLKGSTPFSGIRFYLILFYINKIYLGLWSSIILYIFFNDIYIQFIDYDYYHQDFFFNFIYDLNYNDFLQENFDYYIYIIYNYKKIISSPIYFTTEFKGFSKEGVKNIDMKFSYPIFKLIKKKILV
jgi:hypothetical protein